MSGVGTPHRLPQPVRASRQRGRGRARAEARKQHLLGPVSHSCTCHSSSYWGLSPLGKSSKSFCRALRKLRSQEHHPLRPDHLSRVALCSGAFQELLTVSQSWSRPATPSTAHLSEGLCAVHSPDSTGHPGPHPSTTHLVSDAELSTHLTLRVTQVPGPLDGTTALSIDCLAPGQHPVAPCRCRPALCVTLMSALLTGAA